MNCPTCGSPTLTIGRPVAFPRHDCRERRCKCGTSWSTTERIEMGSIRRVETRVETSLTTGVETLSTRHVDTHEGGGGVSDSGLSLFPDLHPDVSVNPKPARVRTGRPDYEQYPADFETLWKETGRHGNKHPAFKLWSAISTTVSLNTLISRWQEWEKTSQWQAGYIPHLRKWLFVRGWQDPPPAHEFRAPGKASSDVPSIYRRLDAK